MPARDLSQRLPTVPVTPEAAGRYERRGLLGAGGIGMVELAWDRHLGREVAIKRLRPGLEGDAVRRFLKEARIGAALAHPNIVPVYELGRRADGTLYYTMKRVQGRTLAQALAGDDLPRRLRLLPHLVAVCHAMAYAHERGIIHRDLKPDNVMVDAHGETLVVDWGLACERGADDVQSRALAAELEILRRASGTQTVAGAPIGTPAYMPPEQARGDLTSIDERADVYALGALLYELLTGDPPFDGPSALHVLNKVLGQQALDPRDLEPDAPPELCAIATRAMDKDMEARYPNAAALAADLEAFLEGERVAAHAYGAGALARRWVHRHRLALSVLGLLVALGATTWWVRGQSEASARAEASKAADAASATAVEALLRSGMGVELDVALQRPITVPHSAGAEAGLRAGLSHPDPAVRALAIRAMSGMVESTDALAAQLDTEADPRLRIALVEALATHASPHAEAAVHAARAAAGPDSAFWRRTAAVHAGLPIAPNAPPGRLHAQGRLTEALEAWGAALGARPNDGRLLAGRASTRAALGDLTGALADYDRAIAQEDRPDLRTARGRIRHALEDYDGALADLDAVAEHETAGPAARMAAAWTRFVLGDVERARIDGASAARDAPDLRLEWARLLVAMGALDEASLLVSAQAAADLRDPEALVVAGRIAWARGHPAEARAAAERALVVDPTDPGARALASALRVEDGDLAGARRALRPEDRVQRATLVQARAGDFARALTELDALRAQAPPLEAAAMELLALAIAVRVEAPGRWRARATALGRSAPVGWYRDLGAVIRGQAAESRVGGRARHHRARSCELVLTRSLQARLRGDRIGAGDALAAARPGPVDEPACAVVRGLSRR